MEFYKTGAVSRARKLRKQGFSLAAIGKKLSISENAIRGWCYDLPSNHKAFLDAQRSRNKIKGSSIEIIDSVDFGRNSAKIYASLLYWGEGTKYPQSNCVSFSNSDPKMVKLFVYLLRNGFDVDESKFKIHLQLHTTQNKNTLFDYWSKLLKIPARNFWKPTVTKPTDKMKRRNYFGTCTVRYHDYRVLLQIIGIYEKFTERWLSGR